MTVQGRGTQFVSNPFQVLGVSDSPEPSAAPVAPVSGSVDTVKPVVVAAPPAEKKSADGSMTPSHPHLTFLHELGKVLLDDVLTAVLQIGVPILERKL
jgi:hypothetical protein